MKRFFLLIIVCFQFFISCKTNKKVSQNDSVNNVFARIDKQDIFFQKDTILFKKEIAKSIFSKEANVIFDKIRVLKQNPLGNIKEELYYVILYDFENDLKTARVLKRSGDNLIFEENSHNSFKKMFVSCVGKAVDCNPRMAYIDSKINWICGNEIGQCSTDIRDSCKTYRSIYFKNN